MFLRPVHVSSLASKRKMFQLFAVYSATYFNMYTVIEFYILIWGFKRLDGIILFSFTFNSEDGFLINLLKCW